MNVKTFWFLVGSSLKMRKHFILGEKVSSMDPLGEETALVSRLSCFPKILHLFLKEQLNVNT